MKVFISWSGDVSQTVAVGLREWLPNVIQAIDPFVSSEDIAKGGRWLPKINEELDGGQYCIICLTPENLESPWILFEAGAVSGRFTEGRVSPLLIGLNPLDVRPPLSQFQMTKPSREDMLRLVRDLNGQAEKPLPKERLDRSFDNSWAGIEKVLQTQHDLALKSRGSTAPPERDLESMVAEVLEVVLAIQRSQNVTRVADALTLGGLGSLGRGLLASRMAGEAPSVPVSGAAVAATGLPPVTDVSRGSVLPPGGVAPKKP